MRGSEGQSEEEYLGESHDDVRSVDQCARKIQEKGLIALNGLSHKVLCFGHHPLRIVAEVLVLLQSQWTMQWESALIESNWNNGQRADHQTEHDHEGQSIGNSFIQRMVDHEDRNIKIFIFSDSP